MMPRQPRRRAEDDYYWPTPLVPGHAASNIGPADDRPAVAAVLWVPDIDARHLYREHYVYRERDKPGSRPIGFGRRE
jgi:hypothetical protein